MTNLNKIGLAGDWHGQTQWMRHALHSFGQAGIKEVHQVGDFSLGWPGAWPMLIEVAESVCRKYGMDLYITPGNHENWEWINTREFDENGEHWMTEHTCILRRNSRHQLAYLDADGATQTRSMLSLGGAPSIDFDFRVEGMSWWRDEMITLREASEAAGMTGVDIMLAHDAPDGGTDRVQQIIDTPWQDAPFTTAGLRYAREGRELMNLAVYGEHDADHDHFPGVRPKVFAHGHFHAADSKQTDETLFISLGCNGQNQNLAVLDLQDLSFTWLDILNVIPDA